MQKSETVDLLTSFGNGYFLEEVEDSYNPQHSLIKITERIHQYIRHGLEKSDFLSWWTNVANALLYARDIFNEQELNYILENEFNLDPESVGGAAQFFVSLSKQLSEFLNESRDNFLKD